MRKRKKSLPETFYVALTYQEFSSLSGDRDGCSCHGECYVARRKTLKTPSLFALAPRFERRQEKLLHSWIPITSNTKDLDPLATKIRHEVTGRRGESSDVTSMVVHQGELL